MTVKIRFVVALAFTILWCVLVSGCAHYPPPVHIVDGGVNMGGAVYACDVSSHGNTIVLEPCK